MPDHRPHPNNPRPRIGPRLGQRGEPLAPPALTAIKRGARLELAYLHGGVASYLPGETLGERVMHDFELVWIISGEVTYHLNQTPLAAPPGTIVLSRPGFAEAYTWDPRNTTRHAFFHFQIRAMPRDWPPVAQWPIRQVMPGGDVLRPLFRYIVDNWCAQQRFRNDPPPSLSRAVESLLDAWLTLPTRQRLMSPGEPAQLPAPLQRALAYLSQQLAQAPDQKLSLAQLAQAAAVSDKHLCRLFRQELKVSPVQAARLLRLERALALLTRSNLNVKEIAGRCGFASPYHFSRCFTEVYGRPPSQLRQALASGDLPPNGPLAGHVQLPWQW